MKPEEIKIGQKVTHLYFRNGNIFTITSRPFVELSEQCVNATDQRGATYNNLFCRLLTLHEDVPSKPKHVHADLIKAWADGAEVQYKSPPTGAWFDTENPQWDTTTEYRIKPTEPTKTKYTPTREDYVRGAGNCRNKHARIEARIHKQIKALQVQIQELNTRTTFKLQKAAKLAGGKL